MNRKGRTTGSRDRIRVFFDELSHVRDKKFALDPILGFEQERRQQALREMVRHAAPSVGRCLDLGCGNGRDFELIRVRSSQLVGVDLSLGMLEEARGRSDGISLLCASAEILPFEDETFDLVVCSEVIEHMPAWRVALTEIARVLSPGGWMLLTTPNRRSLYGLTRWVARRGLGHEPRHPFDEWKTLRELREALTDVGLFPASTGSTCYVPGHWTYLLPDGAKELIVGATRLIEPFARGLAPHAGYMLTVAAKKPGSGRL